MLQQRAELVVGNRVDDCLERFVALLRVRAVTQARRFNLRDAVVDVVVFHLPEHERHGNGDDGHDAQDEAQPVDVNL